MRVGASHPYLLVLVAFLALGCGGRQPAPTDTVDPDRDGGVELAEARCPQTTGEHAVFAVIAEGKDVGREVRTDVTSSGPVGEERTITSHTVTQMKMGSAHFEARTVLVQRTDPATGKLLRGSHVAMDQVTARTIIVGSGDNGYERLVESRSAVTDPLLGTPSPLPLEGDEVIGFRLRDVMRDVAVGSRTAVSGLSYYEPLLDGPLPVDIGEPLPGTTDIDGQEIRGAWVEARRAEEAAPLIRSFFDDHGALWIEEYPELHQVRRRMPGPLSLPSDTSELLVGLHSEAYVPDPNAASRAIYRLHSTPDRLDALELIAAPVNQTVERVAPDELILEVRAGAPDGDEEPVDQDLADSPYVRPKSREIIGALRYLRSAGKRGRLSEERRYNATPVVARASLISRPGRFWSDPDQVAGLIMHYVSALLPDKKHTFSMADAVTTLRRGAGDCTEHAVLFASLMRAAGIPTRLIAGMQLTRGGMWGYHMWNAYWNGSTWKAIDPSTMSYHPGALYVALGRGTARFDALRDRLADFMWRTFSGVSFDLIEASNMGENLFLARPRSPDQNLKEMALFNAVVLSERGDHEGAISLLDENIPPARRSLAVRMMHIELLVRSGRHDDALTRIASLRSETSDERNVRLLDTFELQCLLTIGDTDRAEKLYRKIDARLAAFDARIDRILLEAELQLGRGERELAISTLEKALGDHPQDSGLLIAFSEYVAGADNGSDPERLDRALAAARDAVSETLAADARALAVLARVLILDDALSEAHRILDHAFVLAPAERTLHELRAAIPARRCPPAATQK